MPTKIRLQRHGKKGNAIFHIVIADGRAPRDGKFIEKLGTYNPTTAPATIDLNFERALKWVQNGAQPTDTTKAILSYKGVMYKHHLLKGVTKGALTLEQAEAKFEAWVAEKEAKIQASLSTKDAKAQKVIKDRLAAEAKIKEDRLAAKAAKQAEAIAAEEEVVAEEVAVEEEVVAAAEEATEEKAAE